MDPLSTTIILLGFFGWILGVVALIKPSVFHARLTRPLALAVFGLGGFFVMLVGGALAPKPPTPPMPMQADIAPSIGASTTSSPAVITTSTTTVPSNASTNRDQASEQPATNDAQSRYKVVNVIDGDTLDVEIEGKATRLRLIGLDTPETQDPRKPVQCFGKEASDKAKELLAGKVVELEADATQDEKDKYGRLLRYVILPNGDNFALAMIKTGFGHEYTYNTPYKYQGEFKAAEAAARTNKLGLWAESTCNGDTTQAANTTSAPTSTPPATASSNPSSGPAVKKSSTGICHAQGTQHYDRTSKYTPYNSLDACLDSGGRLPKG